MVHKVLSNQTYLSLGLLSPLNNPFTIHVQAQLSSESRPINSTHALIKVPFMFASSKYMEEIVHFFSLDFFFDALIAVNIYGFWTL